MHGNGLVNEVAAQRPQPRQSATFVRLGEATVADDVSGQYCSEPIVDGRRAGSNDRFLRKGDGPEST